MLKEDEIRPKNAQKIATDLRIEDIQSMFYKNEKLDHDCFVEVTCPACGRDSNSFEFEKDGFKFNRCNYCNTLYVSPRPNENKLLEYYGHSKSIEYFTKEILEKTKEIRKQMIFKPRAQKIIDLLANIQLKRNVLVDVGGGNGLFLESLDSAGAGFEKYINVEPSNEGANLTLERGFDVFNGFIEDFNSDIKIDLITAFELIEHLFDPMAFLNKISSLLNAGGVFILTTPNIEGFDLLLLGSKSDNIGAPNHLNYFNPQSIKILLEKCNFEIIHIETPGVLDLNIIENKINSEIEIDDKFVSFLLRKDKQTKDNFQKFLMDNNLSSNMMVIARKVGE